MKKENSIYKFTTLEDLEKYATEKAIDTGLRDISLNMTEQDSEKLCNAILGDNCKGIDFTKPVAFRIPVGATIRINPIRDILWWETFKKDITESLFDMLPKAFKENEK